MSWLPPTCPRNGAFPPVPTTRAWLGWPVRPALPTASCLGPKCLFPPGKAVMYKPSEEGDIREIGPSLRDLFLAETGLGPPALCRGPSPESCLMPQPCGHSWSPWLSYRNGLVSAVGWARGSAPSPLQGWGCLPRRHAASPSLKTGCFSVFPWTPVLLPTRS